MSAPRTKSKYESSYFRAKATAASYEKRYNDPATTGFNKFMIGRRMGDYTYFAQMQNTRIHAVAGASIGDPVIVYCFCGLKVEHAADTDYDNEPSSGLAADGHWDHNIKGLAQVFILDNRLVCAGCNLDETVVYDDEEAWDKQALVNWDDLLAAHAGCGFGRFAAEDATE